MIKDIKDDRKDITTCSERFCNIENSSSTDFIPKDKRIYYTCEYCNKIYCSQCIQHIGNHFVCSDDKTVFREAFYLYKKMND